METEQDKNTWTVSISNCIAKEKKKAEQDKEQRASAFIRTQK